LDFCVVGNYVEHVISTIPVGVAFHLLKSYVISTLSVQSRFGYFI
jgi:hypothetical protein